MQPDLTEARTQLQRLRDTLKASISVSDLGVRSKAPYQLLAAQEAMKWRAEEVGRNAYEALERGDLAAAGLLTRAVTESAAFTWKLMSILDKRGGMTAERLNDLLMQLLMGGRIWGEAPTAISILTCVDQMNEMVPGVRGAYDKLSEVAHPNWLGTGHLFSRIDHEAFTTYFGRALRDRTDFSNEVLNLLCASLGLLEYANRAIDRDIIDFLAELEPF